MFYKDVDVMVCSAQMINDEALLGAESKGSRLMA